MTNEKPTHADVRQPARFPLRWRYRALIGAGLLTLLAPLACLLVAKTARHQVAWFLIPVGCVAAYLIACVMYVLRGPAVVVSTDFVEVPRLLPLPRRVRLGSSRLRKVTRLPAAGGRAAWVLAVPIALLGKHGALIGGLEGAAGGAVGGALGVIAFTLIAYALQVGIPGAPILLLKADGRSTQRIHCKAYLGGEAVLARIQASCPVGLEVEDRAS